MRELAAIAVAGALGALARYGVSEWAVLRFGGRFPWGTWLANVAGCFLLGYFAQWSAGHPELSRATRLAVATGFLGAFTTFSTFSYQTVRAVQEGLMGVALANVAANLGVGLLFAAAGIWLAKGA